MAKQKKLRIQSDGKRRFISVSTGRAIDLHNYLRSHRVCSLPPSPSYTGFDSIELDTEHDLARVQALLNAWK